MKIVIFGAAGKVGQLVVTEALARGMAVRAVVHTNNPFSPTKQLTTVAVDIHDRAAVAAAIQECDAVISTLGSWGTRTKDILSTGTAAMIGGMARTNTKRIITLTGAGAFWEGDTPSRFDRVSHKLMEISAGKILSDGEQHLKLLNDSSLNWTCIRSPIMTPSPNRSYHLKNTLIAPWATIPRVAVASALLDQLHESSFYAQAPVICH